MSDIAIQYIKNRKVLSVPQFSLRKIMENYSVAMYENICVGRIVDEVGIDCENVIYDFITGQVNLTCKGIKMCESVLTSYCNTDQLAEVFEYATAREKFVINANNMLWQLRHKSADDLKKLLVEAENAEYTEAQKKVRDWIKAEIESRSVWNKLRLFLQKGISNVMVRILYFRMFKKLREATKEYVHDVTCGAYTFKKDRSEVISGMYKKYREICPDKRSKEETLKYVFYGVLYLGKRAGKYHCRDKECFEIEARYKALKEIVTAAAELTPRDFLNLFPVDKKYDGEKYVWKDYFYTMRELQRFPMDEKIGDKIIPFLEIYTNKHVFKFIVSYSICIGDYSVYCGVDGPQKEYFKVLNMWQEVQP